MRHSANTLPHDLRTISTWQIAIVSSVIVGSTMYLVVSEARRIRTLFYLDRADEVASPSRTTGLTDPNPNPNP